MKQTTSMQNTSPHQDSLEAALSMVHRSRLEIEKADALLRHSRVKFPKDAEDPCADRQAFVRQFVAAVFDSVKMQLSNPFPHATHVSRLQREQVCCTLSSAEH